MRLLARNLQIALNSLVKCLRSFSEIMKVLVILSALCAVALTTPVNPVIVPKVQVAPAQVTVVKQPHVFTEPEPVYRAVPIPIKTVAYTAPHVVPGPVITPVYAAPAVYSAPVVPLAYAAPHAHYIH